MDKRVKKAVVTRIWEDIRDTLTMIVGIMLIVGFCGLCVWGMIKLYDVIKNPYLYITTAMAIFLSWMGTIKFLYYYIHKSIYCNVEYGYEKKPLLNALVPMLNNITLIGISNLVLLITNFVFNKDGTANINQVLAIITISILLTCMISIIWYLTDPFGRWFDDLLDHADRVSRDLITKNKEKS